MDHQGRGRPVVVGIDGSDSALLAMRWAADEARRRKAPLRLVSSFGWSEGHDDSRPAHGHTYRELLLGQTRDRLAAAGTVAQQADADLEVQQHVGIGHPIPVLGSEARHAQLMVVGDRGLGGFTGLMLGSVAVGLAAHADCPVVVVRGRDQVDPGSSLPVVVGVDGSPTSEAAVAFAFEAAAERRVPLVAVHTWWVDPVISPLLDWDSTTVDEGEVLAERLAGWSEQYPDVPVQRVVAHDKAADVLRELSGRAQLIVVGSRGRGGFGGLLLGSVSHALLHHAACPVAVVRPGLPHQP